MTTFSVKISLLAASVFCFSILSPSFAMEDENYEKAKAVVVQYREKFPEVNRTYDPLNGIRLIRAVKRDENNHILEYKSLAWCLKSEKDGVVAIANEFGVPRRNLEFVKKD